MLNDAIFNPDKKVAKKSTNNEGTSTSISAAITPFLNITIPYKNAYTPSKSQNVKQPTLLSPPNISLCNQSMHPIDSTSQVLGEKSAIDFHQLNLLARRVAISYQDPPIIREQFPNTRIISDIGSKGLRMLLETDPDTGASILTIRDSDYVQNKFQGLDYGYRFSPLLGIDVHRGLDQDAEALFNILQSSYTIDKNKPLMITGYSMGGGIANLLLLYLQHENFSHLSGCTFGQPKVTNKKGVECYAGIALQRVVLKKDSMPFLPSASIQSLFYGPFEHFGSEVILLDSKNYTFLGQHCALRRSTENFSRSPFHDNYWNHHINNYVSSTANKLNDARQVDYKDW